MRALILAAAIGIGTSGLALTGCDHTVHQRSRTSDNLDGSRTTKTETIKERPDGSVYKEETKSRSTP